MNASLTFPVRDYTFHALPTARHWIDGAFVDAATPTTLAVTNPRYGEAMGQVQLGDASDVDRAVAGAKAAFPAWQATPIKERVQILYRLKALMERDLVELAWLLSHEHGKVYAQAEASVRKGIECVEFACSLANGAAAGGVLEVSRGVTCQLRHEPLGVVAGVAPFNFPMMVPLWMLPNALAAGNCFVIKPSEQVPYNMQKFALLLQEAGLPDGVCQIVNGAQPVVEALTDHPDVAALAFVGSTRVAKLVYERGARAGKRMLCLGGAKNHLLVVPDADVRITADNVIASAYGTAGQRCMAASVLVAIGDVQHVIDAIAERTRALVLGKDMGPVISAAAKARIEGYIDAAEARGATILVDGRGATVAGCPGTWVGPTVIDHATAAMPCAREEIFGPVLTIVRVDTVDQALAIENANPYGNAACIYTTSGFIAEYCIERFEAGMCGVNIGVPVPREPFAFGGWNDSRFGHGDITGEDGYLFWTRARKVTSKWALQKDWNWMA